MSANVLEAASIARRVSPAPEAGTLASTCPVAGSADVKRLPVLRIDPRPVDPLAQRHRRSAARENVTGLPHDV